MITNFLPPMRVCWQGCGTGTLCGMINSSKISKIWNVLDNDERRLAWIMILRKVAKSKGVHMKQIGVNRHIGIGLIALVLATPVLHAADSRGKGGSERLTIRRDSASGKVLVTW